MAVGLRPWHRRAWYESLTPSSTLETLADPQTFASPQTPCKPLSWPLPKQVTSSPFSSVCERCSAALRSACSDTGLPLPSISLARPIVAVSTWGTACECAHARARVCVHALRACRACVRVHVCVRVCVHVLRACMCVLVVWVEREVGYQVVYQGL